MPYDCGRDGHVLEYEYDKKGRMTGAHCLFCDYTESY